MPSENEFITTMPLNPPIPLRNGFDDMVAAAARTQREYPDHDPTQIVTAKPATPVSPEMKVALTRYSNDITGQEMSEEELREERRLAREKEDLANRKIEVQPITLSPGVLSRREFAPWQQNQARAEHTLSMLESEADKLEIYSYLENDVAKAIGYVKKSGLPPASEVTALAAKINTPPELVRDLLPYAKDELEAKAMAVRLLDIYGGDVDAIRKSYFINQIRGADNYYWSAANAEAKAKFEAALISRYGDYYSTLGDSETGKTIGRFIDQQLYRSKAMAKDLVVQTESTYHGFLSAGAKLVGANDTARDLDRQHEYLQQFYSAPRLNTGDKTVDHLLDIAFIDAPLLYTQMTPYFLFGPRMGGYARQASMWGSELSSMLDQDIPTYLALPLSFASSGIQRQIEQKNIYPRFERLSAAIRGKPIMQRPLWASLYSGVADSIKNYPDEYLQEGTSKLFHDTGYLGTDGATWNEFSARLASGWEGPAEGALKAFLSSLLLVGVGTPSAVRAHLLFRQKMNSVNKVLDAAQSDSDAVDNPERFKETSAQAIENAKQYNQDAPSEVYLSAERFDAIVPEEQRRELLEHMDAREEYSRSHATGADMCIKLESYAGAIANHPLREEFQKYIKVDPDGMSVGEADKAEEVEAKMLAEADALVKRLTEGGDGELPPELDTLRKDLRQFKNLTAGEVDKLASLYYSAAKVAAEDTGESVGEWLNRLNLRAKFADQIKSQEDIDALKRRFDDDSTTPEQQPAADTAAVQDAATPEGKPAPETEAAEQAKKTVEALVDSVLPDSPDGEAAKIKQAASDLIDSVTAGEKAEAQPEAAPEPASEKTAPSQDAYTPTSAERESAAKHATELDRKRMHLGNLLIQGHSLSGEALAEYGLSAWHPQSVRLRMADMKAEAEAWRNFQNNPALVAQVQTELGDTDLPSARFELENKAKEQPEAFLDSLPRTIGVKELAAGLVAPVPRAIRAALRAVYSYTTQNSSNKRRGVVYRVVDEQEAAAYKKAITRDKFKESDFTEEEIARIMKRSYVGDLHIVDSFGIHHTVKDHGNPTVEAKRGQEAITYEAIAMVPDLVSPENLVAIEKTNQGYPVFIYRVEQNGKTRVLEEIRTGRKHLTFFDIYGKWSGLVADHDVNVPGENTVPPPTSELPRFRATPSRSDSIIPSDEANLKNQEKQNVDPEGDTSFEQAAIPDGEDRARGKVTFYEGVTLVRLARGKADFSTLLHEMGHVILEDALRRIEAGKASQTTSDAVAALQKLAGGKFDQAGVEKVIRYWEAYLREGKAPSFQLVSAFDTFRTWLTGIYEDVRAYLRGGEMDDATRSAFDYLLASEREIREVREFYHDTRERLENLPIYKPSERKKIAAKRKQVESDELNRQDKVRIRAFLRALESREPVRNQAEAEVNALKPYAVLADLASEGGIVEAEASDLVGEEMVAEIKKRHGEQIFGKDPLAAQIIAGNHGYDDIRTMLEELAAAPQKKNAIDARIGELMKERTEKAHAWLAETEAVPGDAAYHSGERLELMALQLEGLRRLLNDSQKRRIERINVKAIRDAAATTVSRMLVRDIGRHQRYVNAEKRLGGEVARAARDGDIQAAFEALEQQMFSHAITAAMFKMRERRESFKRGHTFTKMTGALVNMQDDYRDPLRRLLTRYGVVLRRTVRQGPNGEKVVEWKTPRQLRPIIESKELGLPEITHNPDHFDNGPDNIKDSIYDIRENIPGWLQRLEAPANYRDWRDLTVAQMEQLRDAIDLIVDYGRGTLSVLRTDQCKTIDEALDVIVEMLEKSPERAYQNDPDTITGKGFNSLERFLLKGVTIDSIFAVAEGNTNLGNKGELRQYLEIAREKGAERDNLKKEIWDRIQPSLKQLGREAAQISKRIKKNGGVVDGLPFHESLKKARNKSRFTGEMIIAACLNTGNPDNLFQLQNAYGWDAGAIDVLRSQLSKKGWEAVEAIWREFNALYPRMAQVTFEATHKRSPKEPGQSFVTETADGQVHSSHGGYYPLKYDGLITLRQRAFQDVSNAKAMAAANSTHYSNRPASGFSLERVRGPDGELVFKGAPLLSLSPVGEHLDSVLHFITHSRLVWELDRITGNSRFEEAFASRNGMQKYKAVRQWVNYLANPVRAGDPQMRDEVMDFLHDRYIISVLGLNLYSANKQRLGFFTALSPMAEAVTTGNGTITSLKYITRAMWDFGFKGNIGLITPKFNEIKTMSKVMKARDEGGATKDLRDSLKAISPLGGDLHIAGMAIPVKAFRKNLFSLTTICDRATAGPLWLAGFNMYMDGHIANVDGMSPETRKAKAIKFADSIAITQTSPFEADHTPLQRGKGTVAKFASICISGVMQPGNGLYQSISGVLRGNVTRAQCASYIAKTYIAMSYAQLIASTLVAAATGDDDPWPEWYELFLAPIDNMLSWIPYVRNIASASKYGSSGKGVASLEAGYKQVEKVTRAAKKAGKGEYKDAAWQTIQVLCFGTGIPLPAAARIYRDMGSALDSKEKKKKKKRK